MERSMKIVHSSGEGCAGGNCPTIYETEQGTFVIQGKVVSDTDKKKLSIPDDEEVVEIPIDFLKSFLLKQL